MVRSLQQTKTPFPIYVVVPPRLDSETQEKIKALHVNLIICDDITISEQDLKENAYQYWNETFFKLNVMRLTQFEKIIFVDADMIILRNIDHLFQYPSLSATTGGKSENPNCTQLVSGFMVLEPSEKNFQELCDCIPAAILRKKAMGQAYGDQDVFNQWFPEWKVLPEHHIPETYNAITYCLDSLMKQENLKHLHELYGIHYPGSPKIWNRPLLNIIRGIHGNIHDKRYFEAKAYILYLERLAKSYLF